MDDIIDKLTQVGVDRIIPMLTRRVIIKLDKERAGLRLARWQKLALAASGQSQRDSLPEICEFRKFSEVVAGSGEYDLKLIPALIGERRHLKEILGQGIYKNILVLIGPEGDFTPQELQAALEEGFIPVTLGERVLRVDTAAVAVAAFIKLIQGTLP
jgi:16S rRNA (uracil1498-N3)-methyltransferase